MTMLTALALATAGAAGGYARPSPIAVSPTTVEIPDGRRSAVIEVENQGDEPVDLQLRAYDWRQSDAGEQLTPAADVVVSPAITTVSPHGRQLFRVLRSAVADAGAERAYRLRLNQLPGPASQAVGINFEFLLPLFAGGTSAVPVLSATAGEGVLRLANTGGRRARLHELALRMPNGTMLPVEGASTSYVLAGRTQGWTAPAGAALAGARLTGTSDAGRFDVPVIAAPPRP